MAYGILTKAVGSEAIQLSDTTGTYYRVVQKGTLASYGTVNYGAAGYGHGYQIPGDWVTDEHMIFVRGASGALNVGLMGRQGAEKDTRTTYTDFILNSFSATAPAIDYCIVTRTGWAASGGSGLLVRNSLNAVIFNSAQGFPVLVSTATVAISAADYNVVKTLTFNRGAYTSSPYLLLSGSTRGLQVNAYTEWLTCMHMYFSSANTLDYRMSVLFSQNTSGNASPYTQYYQLAIAIIP